MADEAPKIHIDSDWKKQAQEEKKRLAEQVEKKAKEQSAGGGGGQGSAGAEGLPEASFLELLSIFGTQVFMFLGQIPQPGTDQRMVSLPLAKHYIDLLAILEKRTRGNLEADEKKEFDQLLYEARMVYVQMAEAVAAQGGAQGQGGQGGAGGQGGGPTGPIAGPDILGGQGS